MLLLFIYLAFVGIGLPDSLLGAAWPFMSVDFHVNVEDASLLSIMISLGIIFASLMAFRISRRLGFHKTVLLGMLLMAGALVGYTVSSGMGLAILLSFPLGFGSGLLQTACNEYVADRYSASHMSWLHGTWGIGAVTSPMLVSFFASQRLGWRGGYLCVAVFELIMAAFALGLIFRQRKTDVQSADTADTLENNGFSLSFFRGKLCLLGQCFFYCSMENAVMLWGASYLIAAKSFGDAAAAQGTSVFFLGITLGRVLSGVLLKRMRISALITAVLSACLVLCGLLYLSNTAFQCLTVLFLLGCCMAPVYPAVLHQSPRFYPDENQSQLVGLLVASAYVGILALPPILGPLYARIGFVWMPAVLGLGLTGTLLCYLRVTNKNISE